MSEDALKQKIELVGLDPEAMMKMDDFDDCVIGVVERAGWSPVLCYDKQKVVAKLMETQGWECTGEVEEYVEFNQIGTGLGDHSPCFLTALAEPE